MYSRAVLLERLQLALLRWIAVLAAALSAVAIRHGPLRAEAGIPWSIYITPALVAATLFAVVLWALPAGRAGPDRRGHLAATIKAVTLATALLIVLSFFYRGESYSRFTVIVFFPLAVVGLLVVEPIHLRLLQLLRDNAAAGRRVLIVGSDDHGARVGAHLAQHPAYYDVIGYLEDPAVDRSDLWRIPNLGTTADLAAVVREHRADEVILVMPAAAAERAEELIGVCMQEGVDWKIVPPILGMRLDRLQVDLLAGMPLIARRGSRLVGHNWYLKRALDVVVASATLVLLAPVMLLIGIAIAATSRGPIIFRQTRVGRNGRPFTLLKFRTMKSNTSSEVHQDYTAQWIRGTTSANGDGPAVHKLTTDDRITRLGRLLRAVSLDELPQLWNVLRGDMSMVGPRPPIPYEVDRYTQWHRRRLEVPPGVTGLWQVKGRNRLSFDEMVALDLNYIESWTLGLDLSILLRTIPAVVFNRGS